MVVVLNTPSHHRVASKRRLQLKDFVKACCFSLGQLLLCHAYHKLYCGVCVVLLIVRDECWGLLCAL